MFQLDFYTGSLVCVQEENESSVASLAEFGENLERSAEKSSCPTQED